jgi:hypothetical protein
VLERARAGGRRRPLDEAVELSVGKHTLTVQLWRSAPVAIISVIIAAVVGVYYYQILQHQYYVGGPYLYDTELFNYIVGPRGQGLRMPPVINMPSFFYVHVSPILLPFAAISAMFGLRDLQPLEMVLILGFSGAAVAAFVVVQYYLRPLGRALSLLLGALFALAFALGGTMHSTVEYPHIEILYVAPATVALLLIFHRHLRWAWLAFVLTLFVREDAGLHMACILGAYLVLAAIAERGLPERTKDVLPFLAAALIYPMLMLWAQSSFLPIQSNFARIYSGAPAYAHLTRALLEHRVDALINAQPHVLLLLAASLVPFLLRPRWTALTGIVAAVPWFLVSVTALSETAGTLSLYYAFPFLVLPLVPYVVTAELPRAEVVYVDHL